jgi:hypothetical protein
MDRYKDDISQQEKRSEKNKDLYQNTNKYTNITDVATSNVYEINNSNNNKESKTTRENYQKLRKYQMIDEVPKVKKELEDFKYLYQRNEDKIYDINSVLEAARKNKKDKDNLEEKRKLKHTSYNVFSGVNLEELLKYREEKKKRVETEEEKGIRELVDTIASKTLAGEIDKKTSVDLLSDLMATNMLDKVSASDELEKDEEKTEEIEDTQTDDKINLDEIKDLEEKSLEDTQDKKIDKEFYTRSMDLSEEDFEMDNEFAETKVPLGLKIFIFIIILAVVAVAAYFIYKKM